MLSEESEPEATAAAASNQPSAENKGGWYIGKYMGLRNRSLSKSSQENVENVENDDGEHKEVQTASAAQEPADEQPSSASSSTSSTWASLGSAASTWFSWGGGVAQGQAEASPSDIEDSKKESMITATVRNIRAKFLSRQLVGRIYIYRLSGVISTAVLSDVTAEDVAQYLIDTAASGKDILEKDEVMNAELTGNYKRALSTTDTILNSLERRSLAWQGCDFANNTMLTRGSTLGVSDPIVGLIGFSFTLELSATVRSLLASRRRFEAARELAVDKTAAAAEEAGGSRRSLTSFSFFKGNSANTNSDNNNASNSSASSTTQASGDVEQQELLNEDSKKGNEEESVETNTDS